MKFEKTDVKIKKRHIPLYNLVEVSPVKESLEHNCVSIQCISAVSDDLQSSYALPGYSNCM